MAFRLLLLKASLIHSIRDDIRPPAYVLQVRTSVNVDDVRSHIETLLFAATRNPFVTAKRHADIGTLVRVVGKLSLNSAAS